MRILVVLGLMLIGTVGVPTVVATQFGRTVRQVARESRLIIEAEVARVVEPGTYVLDVLRVHKGQAPDHLVIGRTPVRPCPADVECIGRVGLELDDHVLIALTDIDAPMAHRTAIWWIEPDGRTIIRRHGVPNPGRTTLDAVLARLLEALPDTGRTATTATWTPPDVRLASVWPALLAATGAASLVVALHRFRRSA
jgi:hypothetical protein